MFPGDSRGTRGGGRVKEGAGEARREREGRWRGGGGGLRMFTGDWRGTRGGGRVKEGAGEARREREGRWRGLRMFTGGWRGTRGGGLRRVLEKREGKGREDGGGGG